MGACRRVVMRSLRIRDVSVICSCGLRDALVTVRDAVVMVMRCGSQQGRRTLRPSGLCHGSVLVANSRKYYRL